MVRIGEGEWILEPPAHVAVPPFLADPVAVDEAEAAPTAVPSKRSPWRRLWPLRKPV